MKLLFKAFLNITLVFTLMRYYAKGENITTDMPLKICKALNCDITDIMEMEIELE